MVKSDHESGKLDVEYILWQQGDEETKEGMDIRKRKEKSINK
jgi:hypothetical protein